MRSNILEVFKLFKEEGVHYFVLRDYDELDDIIESLDIDIFVDSSDIGKLKRLLKKDGWYFNFINDNKYPHFQYVKIVNNKIVKLDFVSKLRYGKNNYQIHNINYDISYSRKKNDICVCDENLAVLTMLLHIIFDKGKISQKNYTILNQMYLDYNKQKSMKLDSFFLEVCDEILKNSIEETNSNISSYREKIINKGYLKANTFFNFVDKIRINFCCLLNRILMRLRKLSIAVIGVDGSGKSTAIEELSLMYGNKSVVVYMGLKNFANKKLEKIVKMKESDMSTMDKMKLKIYLYIELLRRYLKNRFSYKIVIYDRYVEDNYINSIGRFRYVDNLFYKYLFPKAKIYFYFHCDANTSFSRKNDITDRKGFIMMKERYDKLFLNKKRIVSIDTDENSKLDTIDLICNSINEVMPKSLY